MERQWKINVKDKKDDKKDNLDDISTEDLEAEVKKIRSEIEDIKNKASEKTKSSPEYQKMSKEILELKSLYDKMPSNDDKKEETAKKLWEKTKEFDNFVNSEADKMVEENREKIEKLNEKAEKYRNIIDKRNRGRSDVENKKRIEKILSGGSYGKLSKDYVEDIRSSLKENFDDFPAVVSVISEVGSIQEISKERKENSLIRNKEQIDKSVEDTYDYYKKLYGDKLESIYGKEEDFKEKIRKKVEKKYKKASELRANRELAHFEWKKEKTDERWKGGLHFNDKFRTKSSMESSLLVAQETKFHPVGCNTVKSVIDHEFGHAIERYVVENAKESDSYKELKKFFDKCVRENTIADGLSKYAEENFSEFVAEGYSEYKNNKNPRSIATTIYWLLKGAYIDAKNG